tara:strand:- start:58762 stop:61548 length:2787 start_codon:yes stop_codon:yes gene_type:complete
MLFVGNVFGQTNKIYIDATLDVNTYELKIQQKIEFYNNANTSLDTIFLHNWMNSFRDNETPLSKRMIEDYDKDLYFTKDKYRGYTTINNISVDFDPVNWIELKNAADIIALSLKEPLLPGQSKIIQLTYSVKIPLDKFTKYGRNKNTYFNLRYWYMVPALYDTEWKLMSNLNMDDLLMDVADYEIDLTLPENYFLNSSLKETETSKGSKKTYHLSGKKRVDIELNINLLDEFTTYRTNNFEIESNLNSDDLNLKIRTEILNRALEYIKENLGDFPHEKLLINNVAYTKNPVYGFSQLPSFLQPFTPIFEWDIKMFKALTRTYIDNSILVNRREDMWLADGIQNYLMMNYVSKFYPEVKTIGGISKIWGVRSFNLAKLNFNDKYPFIYQFAARKNIDQALTTRADSLSNFNYKIVNKYKAGLGIRYLDEYIGHEIIPEKIKQFHSQNILQLSNSADFRGLVTPATDKDLSWFFGDYVNSKKKIDYTIKSIKTEEDSIKVTLKNKRNISLPIALYGINKNKILFKKWIPKVDSTTTINIPKDSIERLSLNYQFHYPELNLRDNWKTRKNRLFNRPLQFRPFKDVEDPYYNQVFYTPRLSYNYYDGFQFGLSFSNQAFLNKNFTYKFSPNYGIKSQDFTGSFSLLYEYTPEETIIDRIKIGVAGTYFHYDENLAYQTYTPYAIINFKRKSLRDVGGSAFILSLTAIDRQLDPTDPNPNLVTNKYNVFNIGYAYSKPEIIQDFRYSTNLQIESNFTKLSADLRYRRLTDSNRQFDFRVFLGAFLHNKTKSDFFSYGLTEQSDYLFRLNYFGRSEESGFFSQQYITNEGGFKSYLEQNYANQWMGSINSSVGLWRWVEVYNDVGLMKSKNQRVFFGYENGIRLNFVHEFLEVYFPMYSNNGWEINDPGYATKIRFVLTINPKKIINFAKRGFF